MDADDDLLALLEVAGDHARPGPVRRVCGDLQRDRSRGGGDPDAALLLPALAGPSLALALALLRRGSFRGGLGRGGILRRREPERGVGDLEDVLVLGDLER